MLRDPGLITQPFSVSPVCLVANLLVKTSNIKRLGFPQLHVLNAAGKSWARDVTALSPHSPALGSPGEVKHRLLAPRQAGGRHSSSD